MFTCSECGKEKETTPEDKILSAIFGEYTCKNCREELDEGNRRYAGIMVNGEPLSDYLDRSNWDKLEE